MVMKTLIFGKQFGSTADSLEAANGAVSRRNFLVGMGLVTGTVLIKPATALHGFAYNGGSWKESVCKLVDYICPQLTAGHIREAIYRADSYHAAPSADYHGSFSSRQIINAQVYPKVTHGGRYFEFSRLPYYDSHNPCRRTKDLNVLEIERILNDGEREYYGGVVSPCSERRQLASCGCERDAYDKTVTYYKEDPKAWEPLYVRNFTDGRRSYLGFAVKPRTNAYGQPLKQLLLSPDSV
ncbi:MAG TPA: hypothetical protein VF527_11090 [Pyrinomonadaceae bacterium]|jgi:hypothetical protein